MAKFARVLDFRLTAGGSFPLLVEGEYVRIMTSTGPVEIQADDYDLGPLSPGQGMEGSPFRRLLIVDKSGAPNIGTVLIASSGFIDQRINGDVNVIDGGKSRTVAGNAYACTPYQVATAGNYSAVQLWNPAGSGKNVIVPQVQMSTSAAAPINVYAGNAALPTNQNSFRAGSKRIGGPMGVGECRVQATAGFPPVPGMINSVFLPANGAYVWTPKTEPIVIPPGAGLNIAAATLNCDLTGSFDYWEENV